MKCFVGTSGWAFPHWRGVLYPKSLPESDWLKYYSENFNCVEVNSTFYRSFLPSTYRRWFHSVPDNFKFILKLPQEITHTKRLVGVHKEIREFLSGLSPLSDKVGLILMQLPPSYSVVLSDFEQAILLIRDKFALAVEFRNEYAFVEDIIDVLITNNCCFVNPDSPKAPLRTFITNDILYLRLHGRTALYRSLYTHSELEEISDIVLSMGDRITMSYVIFNNGMEGFSIPNAVKLIELLRTKGEGTIP